MIIGVMGATNAGKSSFIDALSRVVDANVVSVGKILRAKYPPGHFRGHCNPKETAAEALQLMKEGIGDNTKHVILDGQPRDLDQAKWLADTYTNVRLVHLWVDPATREARARARDTGEALELSLKRVVNDATAMYDVVAYAFTRLPILMLPAYDDTDIQVRKFRIWAHDLK